MNGILKCVWGILLREGGLLWLLWLLNPLGYTIRIDIGLIIDDEILHLVSYELYVGCMGMLMAMLGSEARGITLVGLGEVRRVESPAIGLKGWYSSVAENASVIGK